MTGSKVWRVWAALLFVALPLAGSAAETLYVGEAEVLVFDYTTGQPVSTLQQTLGVAQTSPRGSKATFSATITDLLPLGANIVRPSGTSWAAQTLCGDPFSVRAQQRATDRGLAVDLGFTDAPCVTPQEQADCCGCGGTPCGKACSVTVTYAASVTGLIDPDRWAKVGFKVSPERIAIGKPSAVRVEIFTKVAAGRPSSLYLWVPRQTSGAAVTLNGLVGEPPAEQTRYPGGTSVRLRQSSERGYLAADIVVSPTRAGRIVLDGALRAMVAADALSTPALTVSGNHASVERMQTSTVTYRKSVVLEAG